MSGFIDLTQKRFGRLVAVAIHPERYRCAGGTAVCWDCVCDCGEKHVVRGKDLRNGKSTSCGCSKRIDLVVSDRLIPGRLGGMRR